jgi:hypothetical protein
VNTLRLDDMRPHMFRTHDAGRTWTDVSPRVPDCGGPANALREDPKKRGLLYAATERGVCVSFDDGGHWQSLQLNLPHTSIRDLIVKDDDIAVGTHGRGFWILDDVTPLRQMDGAASSGDVVQDIQVGEQGLLQRLVLGLQQRGDTFHHAAETFIRLAPKHPVQPGIHPAMQAQGQEQHEQHRPGGGNATREQQANPDRSAGGESPAVQPLTHHTPPMAPKSDQPSSADGDSVAATPCRARFPSTYCDTWSI